MKQKFEEEKGINISKKGINIHIALSVFPFITVNMLLLQWKKFINTLIGFIMYYHSNFLTKNTINLQV